MKASAVILAAGTSQRFGQDKLAINVGEPAVVRVLRTFSSIKEITQMILVVPPDDASKYNDEISVLDLPIITVKGGATRSESARLGVTQATEEYVLVHDAARFNVSEALISRVLVSLENAQGVIPIVPVTDTQIESDDDGLHYKDRNKSFNVQTPQGFKTELLKQAYAEAHGNYTDDGSLFAEFYDLKTVEGEYSNSKLTYPVDVFGLMGEVRFGSGYDCHRLASGRKLILGGVEIPHDKGLLGVSDADVVLHALMDAVLNACALGDIGKFFPPSDPKYIGADSKDLALTVLKTALSQGFACDSVSITILAEKPRLAPFIMPIRASIAELLGIHIDKVGVGATTTEGVGLVGREEAVAAYATAVMRKRR